MNRHEHICDSLELFASAVMPAFKQRDAARQAGKERELAPYVAAALARKPRMAELADHEIPTLAAFGRSAPRPPSTFSDRGGAIAAPSIDPHAAKVPSA
jgi:hypothetical protein